MQKRYFFIGDSHPKYLVPRSAYKESGDYVYLLHELDEAISFYTGSTMWSFPNIVDAALEATRLDFSSFKFVIFVYGTNDAMKVGKDPLPVCVDRYLDKVVELSERLQLPHPLVLSPTPARYPYKALEGANYHPIEEAKERYKKIDTLLQQGCLARSLDFLSMYDLLSVDGYLDSQYSLDGIHFNNAGKLLYMERLDTYLQPQ